MDKKESKRKDSDKTNRVERNKFGYPIKPKEYYNWIDRNRELIEVCLIISLFLTGSTGIACVMTVLFVLDTM